MWTEGTIGVPAGDGKMTAVHYWVKYYDEPSEWGIDGGRISKLMLKQNGVIVYNYDRGEDVAPQTPEAQTALAILKQEFNEKGDGGLKNAHKHRQSCRPILPPVTGRRRRFRVQQHRKSRVTM